MPHYSRGMVMTDKPENPPAFPCKFMKHKSGEIGNSVAIYEEAEGMTLRDYFAGQALQGMCSFNGTEGLGCAPYNTAERAYECADAMLKARQS